MATKTTAEAEQKLHEFLTTLSESRQAAFPDSARNTYVRQLRGYDLRHVAKAITQMITEPREAFQPAFPDLGTIVRRVEAVRDEQNRRPRHIACGQNGCKGGYLRIKDALYTYVAECECLLRWRGGEQASMPDPMDEHLRDAQNHPERFVPVDACIQVGKALGMARKARAGSANPMADEEFYALKKRLIAEMNERWQAQLSDRKTVAAGA